MATWPDWSLGIPEEIARFVVPREAIRLGLRPRTAGDLLGDRRALVDEIYERLRSFELGYTSTVIGATGNQSIQPPEQVLEHGTPNCVDMTTLFAGVCLVCDLVPLVMLITKDDNTRHALVCVVPRATPRARTGFDLGPIGGTGHVERVGAEACAELWTVAEGEGWIPIETTGVCRTKQWSPDATTPATLSVDEAIESATTVLRSARRIDLVDVHRLQSDGLVPHRPPLPPARRAAFVMVGVAALLVVVVGVVGLSRDTGDEVAAGPMTGQFNLAFAALDAPDELRSDAENFAGLLSSSVRSGLADDPRFEVRGPREVGPVAPGDVAERAAELGADILVHGAVTPVAGVPGRLTADLEVYTSSQTGARPFPLTFGEDFTVTVGVADLAAGLVMGQSSVQAFVHLLDGLAALLADRYDAADERLAAAASALESSGGRSALVPALQAWSLLVRASIEQDPAAAARAHEFAVEALAIAPDSEFAILTELSSSYLSIVPAGPPEMQLTCEAPTAQPSDGSSEEPGGPDPTDLDHLADRIATVTSGFSELGQIQAASLLGRVEVARQLVAPVGGSGPDFTVATDVFAGIIDDVATSENPEVLAIWASDAHRWLGVLSQIGDDVTAERTADHFRDAADLATPLWQARNLALAAHAHRCLPNGSVDEAACLFERAADAADSIDRAEAARFREAGRESGGVCPPDWEPGR